MTVSAKSLMQALRIIAAADPRDIAVARLDQDHLGKALIDGERPDYAFDAYSRTPTREEIETGPELSASGSGADRASRHYSRDTAPQLVSVKVAEALSGLLDSVDELEKSYKLLAANHRGLTKIVGRLAAETGRLDVAKALAVLLSKASSAETDDDETETEDDEDNKETAEAKGASLNELKALMAGVGNGSVKDLMGAMMGNRPVAKAAAIDAIVIGIETDCDAGVITPIEALAGKSAAAVCKAAIDGAVLPGLAKSRIDCLPASIAARFAGLLFQ